MEHLENYDKNNMENMLNNLEEKYNHSYLKKIIAIFLEKLADDYITKLDDFNSIVIILLVL